MCLPNIRQIQTSLHSTQEMAKILSHPRVYSFLHVPVQAASDKVLYDMRRKYSCAEFEKVVKYLIEHVPGMTIATDVICGFPTESKEDYEETLDLVRKYKFPIVHISQFYPRHGTPAARMKRIPTEEVKRRSRALTTLFESYNTRDHHLGSTMQVLVTETARDGVQYVAHNKSYDQVIVPMRDDLMGRLISVRIFECGKHFMKGEIIEESLTTAPKVLPVAPAGALSKPELEDARFAPKPKRRGVETSSGNNDEVKSKDEGGEQVNGPNKTIYVDKKESDKETDWVAVGAQFALLVVVVALLLALLKVPFQDMISSRDSL